jgi:hypothetical protein
MIAVFLPILLARSWFSIALPDTTMYPWLIAQRKAATAISFSSCRSRASGYIKGNRCFITQNEREDHA